MIVEKIRNLDEIKNNSGKYSSVMDEIRRNYQIQRKFYSEMNVNQLWDLIEMGVRQNYKVKQEFRKGFSFTSKFEKQGIHYKVEEYIPNKKLVLIWKKGVDQYWTTYAVKYSRKWLKNSKFIYSESILRQDTISVMRGIKDQYSYKMFYHHAWKQWKFLLREDDEKFEKKANLIDKKIAHQELLHKNLIAVLEDKDIAKVNEKYIKKIDKLKIKKFYYLRKVNRISEDVKKNYIKIKNELKESE